MSNPFATRFIRPGAIEFLFSGDESISGLISQLASNRWRGQIIGPHGTGKSTLLAAMVPALEAAGRRVVRLGPGDRISLTEPGDATIVVVDGYEQLSWWSRWRLKSAVRRRGAGLLVTAHADAGLPTLYQTQPTLDLARRVVGRLLPEADSTISEADIEAAWSEHSGNLRELLFSLFDLYQARTLSARSGSDLHPGKLGGIDGLPNEAGQLGVAPDLPQPRRPV